MRSRNIKPGFFKNGDLVEMNPLARLLFIGLWCYADREGRFEWKPKNIKLEILPGDKCNIKELLSELLTRCFLDKYSVNGNDYGYIINFPKHQNPHVKEKASNIPKPELSGASLVQTPDVPDINPSDSLIPDSLIPDSKKEPYTLPSDEEINESSASKNDADLLSICNELKNENIFKDCFAFKNKMIKQKQNKNAILHALVRCYLKKPKDPYPYCVKIIQVESGNFNERDHSRTKR